MTSDTDGSDFFNKLSSIARTQVKGLSTMWGLVLDQLTTSHAKTTAAWTVNPEGGVTRTADGVVVTSKELVMQVFLNADENYSVKGYNERASNSIGPIYLGLDWGPEYEEQSTKANAAIMAVTRRDAFEFALQETRAALKALPAPVIATTRTPSSRPRVSRAHSSASTVPQSSGFSSSGRFRVTRASAPGRSPTSMRCTFTDSFLGSFIR